MANSEQSEGNRKGEEIRERDGQKAKREHHEETGGKRPSGTRTSRDSTSINPKDPIDPKSPNIPPA